MAIKNKNKKLRFWLAVSLITLSGIIILQVYWIRTSYNEQKATFKINSDNALFVALLKVQFKNSLEKSNLGSLDLDSSLNSFAEQINDFVDKNVQYLPRDSTPGNKSVYLKTKKITITRVPKEKIDEKLQSDNGQKNKNILVSLDQNMYPGREQEKDYLNQFGKIFTEELKKRNVYTPFNLAFIAPRDSVIAATCSPEIFKKIKFKSSVNGIVKDSTSILNNYGLQAAYPDVKWFLINRMSWIFSITFLLIIICLFSLVYLITSFFNQKKNSDIRNDFVNNMTHELKTPISSISVALELVSEDEENKEKNRKYLSIAQTELNRLNKLTEQVLNIASFEAGKIKLVKEEITAGKFVQLLKKNLGSLHYISDIDFSVAIIPETINLYIDIDHLLNVLLNIVENALKYNDNPQPNIAVCIKEKEDKIEFSVQDNGKGIPARYLEKIFERFFRIPSENIYDVKGYGLGLSYVKEIIELHKGTIHVESTVGKGSKFIILLPKNLLL